MCSLSDIPEENVHYKDFNFIYEFIFDQLVKNYGRKKMKHKYRF